MAFKLAEAFVELNTRGFSGVSSTLSKTAGQMSRMAKIGGAVLVGSVTAAGTALFAMGTKAAAAGDAIHKMAARTGASAEFLSEMAFAAEQSGSDVGTLEKGFIGMQRTLLAADRGLTTANESLGLLGLTAEQLRGLNPEQQFMMMADAVAGVADPSQRAALAMAVFGKAGQQLVPLLSEGGGGISALREQAASLGRTMTTEGVQSAADYTDAMNRFQSALGGISQQIGTAVLPAMTSIVDAATPIVTTFGQGLASAMETAVSTMQWAFTQGGTLVAIWYEQVKLAIDNLPERFWTFGINLLEIGEWAWKNFGDIAFTAFDGITTYVINWLEWYKNLFVEVWDYIASGGTDAIEIGMIQPLEGWKNTIGELPKLTKAALKESTPMLEALRQQYDENQLALNSPSQAVAQAAKQDVTTDFNSRVTPTQAEETRTPTAFASLVDFGRQLNQTDPVPKKQLSVLEEIRDAIQEGGDIVPVVG